MIHFLAHLKASPSELLETCSVHINETCSESTLLLSTPASGSPQQVTDPSAKAAWKFDEDWMCCIFRLAPVALPLTFRSQVTWAVTPNIPQLTCVSRHISVHPRRCSQGRQRGVLAWSSVAPKGSRSVLAEWRL